MATGQLEPDIERYLHHSLRTDIHAHQRITANLPNNLTSLTKTIQGLLIHIEALDLYARKPSGLPPLSRKTLPVAERIDQILGLDPSPLTIARAPTKRVPVTCRDYALMLCSILRENAVPARVRCGFASYLVAGRYEDHWVCEYWADRCWRFADAQLDAEHCSHLSIDFDPIDLPVGAFLSAGNAWQAFQAGQIASALFGHRGATGPRMLHVNLARDLLALQGCEVSDWDSWRDSLPWEDGLDQISAAQCKTMDGVIASTNGADCHWASTVQPKSNVPLPFWRS